MVTNQTTKSGLQKMSIWQHRKNLVENLESGKLVNVAEM